MQKIPTPVFVAVIVAAVLLVGFFAFKSVSSSADTTSNIQAINEEIMKNNPKNAPELPPDTSRIDMGARKSHK